MTHVVWTLPGGFQLPMVKLEDGTRLMAAKGAAGALGCSEQTLRKQITRHRDQLSNWTTATTCRSSELRDKMSLNFIKEALGLKYVRSDMRFLIDADFLYLSAHVDSAQAVNLTKSYIEFIINQTREDTVSREEHEALLVHYEQLESHYEQLEEANQRLEVRVERLEIADPFVHKSASLAGSLLAAQKGTKGIRSLN